MKWIDYTDKLQASRPLGVLEDDIIDIKWSNDSAITYAMPADHYPWKSIYKYRVVFSPTRHKKRMKKIDAKV